MISHFFTGPIFLPFVIKVFTGFWHFLLSDHRLSQGTVVRPCVSCLRTTGLPGSLWSALAFLALGPQASPGHCGLALRFLLWDHRPSRIAVVCSCFSCLGTTGFPGALWSGLAFLLWDHRPFRGTVVRPCVSCFGTTGLPGSLWSALAFLALGPHPALKTVFHSPFIHYILVCTIRVLGKCFPKGNYSYRQNYIHYIS